MSRHQKTVFSGLGQVRFVATAALLFVGLAYSVLPAQAPPPKQDTPGKGETGPAGQPPTAEAPAAADATPSATGPVLQIDEPVHDFGEVWVIPSLEHSFQIKNVGTEVLKITNVKPSCGCTISGAYDREIPPGGVGKVPLTLKTTNLTVFNKYATITSNDPKNATTKVTLKGTVKYYVSANPPRLYLGKIQPDEAVKKTVKITANTEQANLELTDAGTLGKFHASLAKGPGAGEYELTVEGNPPFDLGPHSTKVRIKTNVPQQPTLEIPISAYVPARVEIKPEQIIIAEADPKLMTRYITVFNNGETPVEVLSASSSNPAIRTVLQEMAKGKSYRITMNLPADYLPPPAGDKITLKLLDGTEREEVVSIIPRPTPAKRERPAMTMLGKPAPRTTLHLSGGGSYEVGSSEQVTVLNFYTSWCGFCRRQMPVVEKTYQAFKDNLNVRFIAVSQDERTGKRGRSPDDVVAEFNKRELTYDLALDQDKTVGGAFHVTSYPSLFVLGKDGRIEAVHLGAQQDLATALKNELDQLLAGQKLAHGPGGEADAEQKAKPAVPELSTSAREPQ